MVARWVWVQVEICGASHCGSFFSVLLFTFSALKEPVKELKLQVSFMSGEKYVNKIFLLFSGSESTEVSPN